MGFSYVVEDSVPRLVRDMAEKIIFLYHPCVKNPKCPVSDRFGVFFQQPRPVRCQRLLQIMEARGGEAVHIDFNVCQQLRKFFMGDKLTQQPIIDAAAFQILLGVVLGVSIYKAMGNGAAISGVEWIYTLFAGHGTGYFQVLPFLELLIISGVPLYLLAAFVEQTVNGQSIFVSVRSKGRRHLVKGILSVSIIFLMVYIIFWLMAGLIGASLFSTGLTIVSFRLMLYAVLMKCLDILVQYLIMLGIYIATRQVTIGFLVLVAGNLLCIIPGNWVAYLPFGLSSLTRISIVEPGIGISAVSAFGIEAAILTLMIAGILMWGYKKILN